MPRGPKGEKRHADTVQNAMLIGRSATGGDTTGRPQPVHIERKACSQAYTPEHTVPVQGFAGRFPQALRQ